MFGRRSAVCGPWPSVGAGLGWGGLPKTGGSGDLPGSARLGRLVAPDFEGTRAPGRLSFCRVSPAEPHRHPGHDTTSNTAAATVNASRPPVSATIVQLRGNGSPARIAICTRRHRG